MTRIVQLANFVAPTSGGISTTLQHLAAGYTTAGVDVVQVLPARSDADEESGTGRRVLLRAPEVPGTGYRVHVDIRRVLRVLDRLQPDRVEVHDRTTLRRVGDWARAHGVPSVVVSHERLDRWLHQWLPGQLPLNSWADRSNADLARRFDAVLCTTEWAAEEFMRLGVPAHRIPLGVDLDTFHPDDSARAWLAGERELLLVAATRLSKEKRPDLAVDTVAELVRRGHRPRLVVAGDGPLRAALERRARGLPVEFAGHVAGRERVARLLGAADVALAPGPVETFGLAALEALACGTPVVAHRGSALAGVVGSAGRVAPASAFCFADAVEELVALPVRQRREAARARAERFPWQDTVSGFHGVHRVTFIDATDAAA